VGKHLRKANGQLNGSVGDGRDNVPTPAPARVSFPSPVVNTAYLDAAHLKTLEREWTRGEPEREARAALHAGVAFLEPYPGPYEPWQKTCTGCGAHNTTSLHHLRTGRRPRCGCYQLGVTATNDLLAQAFPGWEMKDRLGTRLRSWVLSCRACGAQRTVDLYNARSTAFLLECDCTGQLLTDRLDYARMWWPLDIPEPGPLTKGRDIIHGTCRTCGDTIAIPAGELAQGTRPACSCTPVLNSRISETEAQARVLAKFPHTVFLHPYPGSTQHWSVQCGVCGQQNAIVLNRLANRQSLGCGCSVIGRVKASSSELTTTLTRSLPGYTIVSVTGDGGEAVVCLRCPEGHDTTGAYTSITSGREACIDCRTLGGYRPDLPGYFYLITGEVAGRPAVKFGITNYPDDRLAKHARSGLGTVVALHGFTDGTVAAAIERECKQSRLAASIPHCTDEGVRFDGSTETVFLDAPRTRAFIAKTRTLIESLATTARTDEDTLTALLAS
jgi:hypothetical protein